MPTAKLSATLDSHLIEEVRSRVGKRGVSAFVNEAVAEKLQKDRVLDLLRIMEEEGGPPSPRARKAASAELGKIFRGR